MVISADAVATDKAWAQVSRKRYDWRVRFARAVIRWAARFGGMTFRGDLWEYGRLRGQPAAFLPWDGAEFYVVLLDSWRALPSGIIEDKGDACEEREGKA